jgi:hypothetical protein
MERDHNNHIFAQTSSLDNTHMPNIVGYSSGGAKSCHSYLLKLNEVKQ